MPYARTWAIYWTGTVVVWSGLLAADIFVWHTWLGSAISVAALAVFITNTVNQWRIVREHRRTQRDRQRAGTGTSGSAAPGSRAHSRALRAGHGPGAAGGSPRVMNLPERDDTQPYLGWKHARLIWIPGDHYLFGGVSIGKATQYGLRARARCLADSTQIQRTDHTVPDEQCSCGFYAHAQPPSSESMQAEYVALEVELGGRVIVCNDGYRAQWQRVLNIIVPQVCYACEQKATSLAIATDDGGPHQALPWCEEHLESMHTLTFASVASDLGVGVSWKPWT